MGRSGIGRWSGARLVKTPAWLMSLAFLTSGTIVAGQDVASMSGAEKLHRLDIMLKVSAARCEASGSDLRADYIAFARNHRFALAQASRDLRIEMDQRHGPIAGDRAYEHLNFELADTYRQRHPWLDCKKLKIATRGLAVVEGDATLLEAASQILPDGASRHLAALRPE